MRNDAKFVMRTTVPIVAASWRATGSSRARLAVPSAFAAEPPRWQDKDWASPAANMNLSSQPPSHAMPCVRTAPRRDLAVTAVLDDCHRRIRGPVHAVLTQVSVQILLANNLVGRRPVSAVLHARPMLEPVPTNDVSASFVRSTHHLLFCLKHSLTAATTTACLRYQALPHTMLFDSVRVSREAYFANAVCSQFFIIREQVQ